MKKEILVKTEWKGEKDEGKKEEKNEKGRKNEKMNVEILVK